MSIQERFNLFSKWKPYNLLLDTEECMEKSPNRLEREILNEISQQEMFSQDLMNRIETLETDIFIKFW